MSCLGRRPINTAEFIATFLADHGIKHAFGMPGGEVLTLIDALHHAGIAFHLVHHEAAAAFAGDAIGQITGRPGVCVTTLGPGAANVVPGVASAWGEHSPVLILTGDLPERERPTTTHQALDLSGLFTPITVWTGELTAENVRTVFPQAFRMTTGAQRGPVHCILSPSEAERSVLPPAGTEPTITRQEEPMGDLAEAERLVRTASRVVIVAGLAVAHANAGRAVKTLAETWQAPVVVTPKAKGQFPEDHALFAGTYGPYGHGPVEALLAQADVIVGAGLHGVDFIRPWHLDTPVIRLTAVEAADPTYRAAVTVVGQLAEILTHLAESTVPADVWPAERIAACRSEIASQLVPTVETKGLAPQTVLHALRRVLPRDGVLTCDAGAHKMLACQQWPAYQPNTFFVPNGLSAMGYALPAALAAALTLPERKVVCMTGDGALLMYAGELKTLVRTGVPVTVVVLVDDSLSLIEVKQERLGYAPTAVQFSRSDFVMLAESLGLPAIRITDADELKKELTEAVAADRAVLVEVEINPAYYRALS